MQYQSSNHHAAAFFVPVQVDLNIELKMINKSAYVVTPENPNKNGPVTYTQLLMEEIPLQQPCFSKGK